MNLPYINDPRIKRPTDPPVWTPDPVQVMDAQALSPKRSPIGLNVRQDVNYADVLAYVKAQGGVTTMLFHMDAGNLSRLHDFKAHVDVLIWRPREFTSEKLHEQTVPEVYIDFAREQLRGKGFAPGEVWIHLHNESVWSAEVIEWERRAAEHALRNGERVVLLNQAVGNPHETQIHMARPLLKLAGEHPDRVILGIHEYFSVWGNRTYPYYIGRWQHDYQSNTQHSFESYRKSVKELKAKPVRYIVTEWGADHISDDEPYTNTLPKPRGEIAGVHTLTAVWERDYDKAVNPTKRPYPGLDTAYFEQLRVAWETGQYDNPEMLGVCIFSWGSDGGKWAMFDVSGMSKLHELLAKWRPIPLETQPENNPVPAGFDKYVLNTSANVRLRKAAGLTGEFIVFVPMGAMVHTSKASLTQPVNDAFAWVEVYYTDENPIPAKKYHGWVALIDGKLFDEQFTPLPPVENPPVPPKEPPVDPDDDTGPVIPVPDEEPEVPAALTEAQVRAIVREENAKALLVMLDIVAGLRTTLNNSIEHTINLNVIELHQAIEQYKTGA